MHERSRGATADPTDTAKAKISDSRTCGHTHTWNGMDMSNTSRRTTVTKDRVKHRDFKVEIGSMEGKDMYLILENDMLNLVDPMDHTILHSQPIVSIRVWGVGRDNGRVEKVHELLDEISSGVERHVSHLMGERERKSEHASAEQVVPISDPNRSVQMGSSGMTWKRGYRSTDTKPST
ncbi:Amyloid beta A4 precursor protein-binding family B member 2 [Chelonia mydas]|uniref:Amyloid beta A4 protein-binding family B member 2 n=1 Tax=Chelonia mydas TaxID=8469 RepID=M7BBM3_CHEMY|nr:Amyloid beta A4 precursor protein-binding family B member 2 [Chelonia mydas]